MSMRKQLLAKLFRHKTGESTLTNSSVITDMLSDEYGITVCESVATSAELLSQGYTKVDSAHVEQLTSFFQYVPQIGTRIAESNAVHSAFDTAIANSYKVVVSPGSSLLHSRKSTDAFRALVHNPSAHFQEQAELFINDATLSISKVPQIALGVFNAASFITGQYFMASVSAKLSTISNSISRIERYLDIDRHSRLNAAYQELSEIQNTFDYIIIDSMRVQATLNQIHDIQRTARTMMNQCRETISTELHCASENDKDEKVSTIISTIGKYILEYQQSVQLFGIAKLFEVLLHDDRQKDSLNTYLSQITEWIERYQSDYATYQTKLEAYLERCNALNRPSLIESLTTYGSGAITLVFSGFKTPYTASNISEFFADMFNDKRRKKKEQRMNSAQRFFNDVNEEAITAPATALESYIDILEKPIEFIRIGDDYYTNVPNSQA